jgi:hypothetical protein
MPPILFLSLRYVRRKLCTNHASRVALSPNGPYRASTWVPSSVSKMISMPMVRSVQTVLQPCTDTNTISKWTTMRFHTTHVTYEFHRVRLKLFMCLWYVQRKLCAYVVSELALSPNGTNRAPPDPRRLRSTSGASKMIYDPMVHLTQTKHLSCTDANTVSKQIETDRTELPLEARHK